MGGRLDGGVQGRTDCTLGLEVPPQHRHLRVPTQDTARPRPSSGWAAASGGKS